MRIPSWSLALLALVPLVARAQPAPTATGWFGGAYLGATAGNYDIDQIANIGAGAFDAGGAIGVTGGRLWRRIGFAVGGELQQLLDQRDDRLGATRSTWRTAPGLASARVDLLVPLSGTGDEALQWDRKQRLLLVAGLAATRLDGALGSGTTSTPELGLAEVRGVGWSVGGQWTRALSETQWLVADARFERFRVTSGRVNPLPGSSAARTPSGGGTNVVVRLGARMFLPNGR
ncbi:MAG: hypothetical protein MUD17_11665 [Gemmatimonadaceae bacterium]|jgi:hypothetical protein|nr:hypothetical protein [Gemmatimonadaceae bacterium]